jgi:hypothetical protein
MQVWKEYVDANRLRRIVSASGVVEEDRVINKDRKRRPEGREYTASIVTVILTLTNALPYELYDAMLRVRGARNNWVHDLQPVSPQTSWEAVCRSCSRNGANDSSVGADLGVGART